MPLPLNFLSRVGARKIHRIERFAKLSVWSFLVEIVGLVANGVAPAAFHSVIVVIDHFLERPTINYRLVALETFALLSFECFDGDGTKFDSLHRAPRIDIAFENLNSVKAGLLERGQKTFFRQGARNAAAPKFGVVLHFLLHFFIADDVADNSATAFLEHAEDFIEELSF